MKPVHLSAACLLVAPVAALGLPAALGRAQSPGADLAKAYRAKEVLVAHCAPCHGGAASPAGGLRILDNALLVKEGFVTPGTHDSSELLDLVEGGSMPPGNRPKVPPEGRRALRAWIKDGAPPLPADHGEYYVLRKILDDVKQLAPRDVPHARYLSLNHLLAEEGRAPDLTPHRDALAKVLRYLTRPGQKPPAPQPVERTETIFRIDLRELGWERPPFPGSRLVRNLYDLALLEYPDGSLATGSDLFPELAGFLRQAGQIRPIAYVRADWFVRAVTEPPLRPDFLKLLGLRADSRPPDVQGPVRPAAVGSHPPFPQAARPALWEQPYDHVLRPLRAGTPVVPLDALTGPRCRESPALTVELHTVDPKSGGVKNTFSPGDRMGILVRVNKEAVIELVYTDADGKKALFGGGDNQVQRVKVGETVLVRLDGEGFPIKALDPGVEKIEEQITAYAYPKAELDASSAAFPAGERLRADGVNDRVVHPFYELGPGGKGLKPPDPGRVAKATATFTVRAPRAGGK
jgi:hypothetical protein